MRKYGMTLIEVMVALIIISFSIAVCSKWLSLGLEKPYMIQKVEPLLVFIEDISIYFIKLPLTNALFLKEDTYLNPFPAIKMPRFLQSLEVTWRITDTNNIGVGVFKIKHKNGQIIEWKVYKKTNSSK